MDTLKVLGQAYIPRVIDAALESGLRTAGAVVIEGARATGKTMTALNAAASYAFIDDPEVQRTLTIAPQAVLAGEAPRLLDEWHLAPELWNLVRRAVDAASQPGRFILTGSALPADDVTRHTGAGRFLRIRQRTMSWWEKLSRPPTEVSLASLFAGERPDPSMEAGCELEDVIENLLRPGFPGLIGLGPEQAARVLRGYIDEVARADVRRLAEVRHAPEVIRQL